jgi:hypothetical protein
VSELNDATSPEAASGRESLDRVLENLEYNLREATRAVAALRDVLMTARADATPSPAPPAQADNVREFAPRPPPPDHDGGDSTPAGPPRRADAFDRFWDRIEQERRQLEKEEGTEEQRKERHGLDALPQLYMMTVEDREGRVDLVPLHRALAGATGAEEINLVSYANGVPVISMRVEGELDLDRLGEAVASAMDRECEVIPQDNGRVYLRMRARQA